MVSMQGKKSDRLNKESDKISDKRDQLVTKRKGKFGKFDPPKKKKNMAKEIFYGCQKFGHYRRDCTKFNRDNEEAHFTKEVKEHVTKTLEKEEEKISLL